MKTFILSQEEDWEQLVDARTNEVLVENHQLTAQDVLIALKNASVLDFTYDNNGLFN